jgi:NADH-quinone oxidoreductase subunit M
MYQRVFYGNASDDLRHHMPELNMREWVCIAPLIAMMLWMGIYTQSFLPAVSETNSHILDRTSRGVISAVVPAGGASNAR